MKAGALVAVVVMGDPARSPRMLNHARELAAGGFAVVLIGYRGRGFEVPAGVRLLCLEGGRSAPRGASGIGFIVQAGLRMSRLYAGLLRTLLREKPRAILVQNPPSFPTLMAAAAVAKRSGARLIVDWHNYGFSLLALRLGAAHWLVRLSRWYEFRAGRMAARHFCVSRAMQDDLRRRGIGAEVLYDRPLLPAQGDGGAVGADNASARRVIAVCPAGWTADEDMEMLLDALDLMADSAIIVYITGEGPKRAELAPRLRGLRAKGILDDTGFLPAAEYWGLIRRAEVGLSLHRSSSGLDLAMKVVDLFGARVPVCAFDYGGSIGEQIEHGVTGFRFRTAAELAGLLARIAADPGVAAAMRNAIGERWSRSWSEEWRSTVLPVLTGAA